MKRAERNRFFRATWFMIALVAVLSGCKDDDDDDQAIKKNAPPLSENAYVNLWIQENMEIVYLWNDEIPAKPDTSLVPDEFFETLLSNEDRFSWIQEDYLELLNSLSGINKEAGYDIKLYRESPTSDNVIAQVMYIKENSRVDIENIDLMRGDKITQVNGQTLTLSNYQTVLGQLSENHSIKYERFNEETDEWVDKGTIDLTTAEYAENPNFMHKVIDLGGGKKLGYYVYNFFAVGPTANSTVYNDQMDAVFAEFNTAGVTDLVLDLRYNSGGAEGATINLASLIGNGVNSTKTFTRREYNPQFQAALIRQYGPSITVRNFSNEANNIGSLSNNRVYILTSGRTASASELLINGLKPFMDVFLIGDLTVGKNVGSISIYEDDDEKNTWGIQPIVTKSYNSLNESNYSDGFEPNIEDLDNSLVIYPLGDENEALLSRAINHITGGSGARKRNEAKNVEAEVLATSADIKRGSYNLIVDDERLKSFIKSSLIE
jgi:C-terminal processing protease CtpA/Prc